jgi:hypothetical protein
MGRMYEQTVAVENLRRTIAGLDGAEDDTRSPDSMIFGREADLSREA